MASKVLSFGPNNLGGVENVSVRSLWGVLVASNLGDAPTRLETLPACFPQTISQKLLVARTRARAGVREPYDEHPGESQVLQAIRTLIWQRIRVTRLKYGW